MEEMTLKITDFEGPLDLLLHLIKENKMDLLNIKLEVIIKQYMEFLDRMEQMNLDIASSYLVMASELTYLKSNMLLPKKEEEIEEEDPKERLIQRLIEYQKYKDLTGDFRLLEENRREIYTRLPSNLKEYCEDNKFISKDVTLDDLMKAFQKFLERKQLEKPLTTKITKKEISVEERTISIRKILRAKGRVSFTSLFEFFSKEYVVATFLAILEMAKNNEIKLVQNDRFGEITCEVENE